MAKTRKKVAAAKPPASELPKITVRYSADMLTAINQQARKLGLDRGNLLRAAIAEHLDWQPNVVQVDTGGKLVAVTIRMPEELFAQFKREAKQRGLDMASLARMWTLEKTHWRAK